MAANLTANFLRNARGVTFADGGGVTWSFNANTNSLSASVTGASPGSITNADLANMAANTLKGNNTAGPTAPVDMTVAQAKTMLSLNLVENTALSTWGGSANLVTLGTIVTGVWNGTAIASGNIAAALTGKTYNGLTLTAAAVGFTIQGGTTPETLTVNGNATVSGTNTGDQTLPTAANPTGSIGLAAANGVAATFTRSDATHALDVSISPTWTGTHTFNNALVLKAAATVANAQILQWLNSTGVAQTVLRLHSDNNTYLDAPTGQVINLRPNNGASGNFVFNASGSLQVPIGVTLSGAAPNGGASTVSFGGTIATTASSQAGGGSLPALLNCYLVVNVNGATLKIPCYPN